MAQVVPLHLRDAMHGDDWRILVVIVPAILSGLLGICFAEYAARANAALLRWLKQDDDLIEFSKNTLAIRIVGFIALAIGIFLLLFRIAQQ